MAIELIDTLAPKNGGTFPMVNGADVTVGEGDKRLPQKLAELAAAAGDVTAATDDDIDAMFAED